jgi:predicted transposase YbfD/YdcC
VTIDAIGTQTEIVKTIVDGGADYLLSVKENQGNLFDDIQYLFEVDAAKGFAQVPHGYAYKVSKGHGRLETRECWAIDNEEYLAYLRKRERWPGLKSIVRILAKREMSEKVEIQISYFITSLPADAKAILKAKRSHWKIENQLRWVLDIAFREDDSRVREDHMGLKIWQSYATWR